MYSHYRDYFSRFENANAEIILNERNVCGFEFLKHARGQSDYHQQTGVTQLNEFPVLGKKTLLAQLKEINTISESQA